MNRRHIPSTSFSAHRIARLKLLATGEGYRVSCIVKRHRKVEGAIAMSDCRRLD